MNLSYKISYSFHSITWRRMCFLFRSLSNGWSLMLVSQLLIMDRMNNGHIPFLSLSKNSLIYQRNRKSRENIWNSYFFWTSILTINRLLNLSPALVWFYDIGRLRVRRLAQSQTLRRYHSSCLPSVLIMADRLSDPKDKAKGIGLNSLSSLVYMIPSQNSILLFIDGFTWTILICKHNFGGVLIALKTFLEARWCYTGYLSKC